MQKFESNENFETILYQNNPNSIVLLKDSKLTARCFSNSDYYYIKYKQNNIDMVRQYILKNYGVQIKILISMKNFRQNYRKNSKDLVIICSQYNLQQIKQFFFLSLQNVQIVFFQNQSLIDKQTSIFVWSNLKKSQKKYKNIGKYIESQKYQQSFKIGSNFLFLRDQVGTSNILRFTLNSMLRQIVNKQKIMENFLDLIQNQLKDADDKDAINSLKIGFKNNNSLIAEAIMKLYSRQNFIHRVINNFLRLSSDPTQLFFIQPIVKNLFEAIQQIGCKQRNSNSYHNFICYRGAFFSQKQINIFKLNQGYFVQSLSFLSTTLSKQIAMNFMLNAFIIITVQQNDRIFHKQPDFAFLKEGMSNYLQQKQVLFNPLTIFYVEKVVQTKMSSYQIPITEIHLKYGVIDEIYKKKNRKQQLNNFQTSTLLILDYQNRQLDKYKTQGKVLLEFCNNVKIVQQYLDTYKMKINELDSYQNIIYLLEEAKIYQKRSLWAKSLNQFNKVLDMIRQHNDPALSKDLYLQVLLKCVKVYRQLQLIQKAENYIEQIINRWDSVNETKMNQIKIELIGISYSKLNYEQVLREFISSWDPSVFDEKTLQMIKLLKNVCLILNYNQKYQQSIQFMEFALNLEVSFLGQYHSQCLQTRMELANLYLVIGNQAKFNEIFSQWIEIYKEIFGQTQYDIQIAIRNCLDQCRYTFEFVSIVNYYQRVINFIAKTKYVKEQKCQQFQQYLVNVSQKLGKLDECELLCKQMCNTCEGYYGTLNQNYAHCLFMLANILISQNKQQESLFIFKKCLQIWQEILKIQDITNISYYQQISHCYFVMDDFQQASNYLDLYQVKIMELQGHQSNKIVQIYLKRANILILIDKMSSVQLYWKVLSMGEQVYGPEHFIYGNFVKKVGQAFLSNGLYNLAVQMLRKAEGIYRQFPILNKFWIQIIFFLTVGYIKTQMYIQTVQLLTNKQIENYKQVQKQNIQRILQYLDFAQQKLRKQEEFVNQKLKYYSFLDFK